MGPGVLRVMRSVRCGVEGGLLEMKNRYRVKYVGDDSEEHSKIVWAEDHRQAVSLAKASGAEIVLGVRRKSNPWLLALCVSAVLGVVLFLVLRG